MVTDIRYDTACAVVTVSGPITEGDMLQFVATLEQLHREYAYQTIEINVCSPGEQSFLDTCRSFGVLCVLACQSLSSLEHALAESQVPDGYVNVHGHAHDEAPGATPHINVSVEQLAYRPITLARLRGLAEVLIRGEHPPGTTTLARLDVLCKEILEASEGVTIAELEVQAEGVAPDSLPRRITELNNKIDDELEPWRTELAETKGREEKELEIIDGSNHAALLADQIHAIPARIRSDAESYVQAKLAGKILCDQIERYRRENQGPLVKRASEHFCALTLGAFDGLMTDFNEKDEPVLAGIRSGGERVYVGGMNSGTRDQLYLALRLASLEKYMESAEPMPFIVDDVLVDFDDARSQAALNAVAELAEKTQVIPFTHHSQVVEQSRQLRGSVHEL